MVQNRRDPYTPYSGALKARRALGNRSGSSCSNTGASAPTWPMASPAATATSRPS
ncbi:alpha/beta hydrolase [Streptomyces angustmyceticus]|uniref:alpha/beta hydrolase n=1 Tax=Streptomyces angustmyceticus TaxID=285578 RepID=UPI003827EE77